MPWVTRGLRDGIVTSRYPRRPDGYGQEFRGAIVVYSDRESDLAGTDVAAVTEGCPTQAISIETRRLRVDRGRCILCGRCAEICPDLFAFDPGFETSAVLRSRLVVPELEEDDAGVATARNELARRVKALRRSVHIRHVDAGSDGAEEWEVAALTNPVYDVQRLGIYFTASPRHADLLLVTGVGTAGMRASLEHTFEVMPDPKVVIAAGVDAISGGLLSTGYASGGGITGLLPVDVLVPGSPPSPFGLLHGILLAVGLLQGARP
ncbi:MAG: NADH-quinone oxidoreductase subunit B family protein [Acidimicrobiales bacterium]